MYVILWEFVVQPEKVHAFVAAYKSDGAWAQLFAQSDGYLGTALLSSTNSNQQPTFTPSTVGRPPRTSPASRSNSAPNIERSTPNSKA
jgi:hypothetical protein